MANVTAQCPVCENKHDIAGSVMHDPGVWRTANGDGWPESWDVDFDPAQCPAYSDGDENADERIQNALITAYQNR